jgi:hypothetical protein
MIKEYILARMREPSSLRGVVLLVGGLFGINLAETDAVTLIAAANVVSGIVGAFFPDKV